MYIFEASNCINVYIQDYVLLTRYIETRVEFLTSFSIHCQIAENGVIV